MSEIGIISNPHAKLNKRNPNRQLILSYIAGERGFYQSTQNISHLKEVIHQFREKGVKIIAINGGDGTISQTVTAMIKEYGDPPYPQIAILRGGTINMLATNLGIRGRPESLLYKLMLDHSLGDVFRVNQLRTLEIDGNYGFLFANGMSAQFLEKFYENKTGAVGSIALLAKIILSRFFGDHKLYNSMLKEHLTDLIADSQKSFHFKSISVLCSTVKKLPLGVELFLLAGPNKPLMQCTVITSPPRSAYWRIMYSIFANAGESDQDKTLFTCKNLQIKGETFNNYTIDGELYYNNGQDVTINLGPEIEFVLY